MENHTSDILVIGGGIAGASIAAHLAEHASVRVLEMEEQPGYHSTGRSAALFSQTYGNETIRALSRASRPFFFSPPQDFCAARLVNPRPVMVIGTVDQREAFEALIASDVGLEGVELVDAHRATELCPVLRSEGLLGGVVDRGTADIEVHELHHGYLRLLKNRGGSLTTSARVTEITRKGGGWNVRTGNEVFTASILVNAAGAWAGEIGAMAGAQHIGLEPRRRTAALIELPAGLEAASWPMVVDVEERFYLKPDAGLVLLSPADETLVEPGDVQPEEIDIAIAIDRLETATTLVVRRLRGKWAGLRSFVRDRSPVVGYDRLQPGFFWLAALGGYGIQTAPALSTLAASLLLERPIAEGLIAFGLRPEDMAPDRLS